MTYWIGRSAVAGAALMISLAGCSSGSSQSATTDETASNEEGARQQATSAGPLHRACKPVPPELLDRITSEFTSPVKVLVAYQAESTDTDGYTAITVGTDGFPKGVSHEEGEISAPDFGLYKGQLYTASGQAIRYTDENLPNVTDTSPMGPGIYDDAAMKTFECVKAELQD